MTDGTAWLVFGGFGSFLAMGLLVLRGLITVPTVGWKRVERAAEIVDRVRAQMDEENRPPYDGRDERRG